MERAVRAAFAEAGRDPATLSLLVSGGATLAAVEGHVALLQRLGASPRCCAPKARLGEGFAFASAALAVVGALALTAQTVPPTGAEALPAGWRACVQPEAAALETALLVAQSAHGSVSVALLGVAE